VNFFIEKIVFRLKYCLFSVNSTIEEDVFAMLIGGQLAEAVWYLKRSPREAAPEDQG
jgi:hypothetical protein